MVTVKFRKSGHHLIAQSEGHATGSTELCAAISAVMSVLTSVAKESYEGDGRYYAVLGNGKEALAVFNAVRHTLERINFTHPGFLHLAEGFDDFNAQCD